MSTTYDQWKATDEAGDDADVRIVHPEPDSDECPGDVDWFCPACGAEIGDGGPHTPDCAAMPPPVMVRCRACGANFPNPYGGEAEAALCDGCLAKPPDDAAIDRVRRMP